MFFVEDSLEQSTSFHQLCPMLPRLVLKTRTRFSAFLARTFFLIYDALGPCTVVFPGLCRSLDSLGAGLPHHEQGTVASALSQAIVACHCHCGLLNYQYNGLRPVPLGFLRRTPSLAQTGRSGPEFIARLIELSSFAQEIQFLTPRAMRALQRVQNQGRLDKSRSPMFLPPSSLQCYHTEA